MRAIRKQTILLAQAQAFFEAYGGSRFKDIEAHPDQKVTNHIGFKRAYPNESKHYFVLPEMFQLEVCYSFEPRRAAKILVEAGMLKAGAKGKPFSLYRLGSEGVKRCYHFVHTEPQ